MTPTQFKSIREQFGLTQSELASILRIKDIRTIRRWEKGDVPVTGPVSLIMEMIDVGHLPGWWTKGDHNDEI